MISAYLFLLLVGLFAGCLSGMIGTGASLILLPVLVPMFDATRAIPIMAIAGVMANAARVMTWHRQIDWRAVAAYAGPGMPAAAAGAFGLLTLPPGMAETLLGLFIVALVPLRRALERRQRRLRLWQLALAGAAIGFLTGMFLSTGPLSVPAFLSYGLVKGGFLSTEAAASLLIQITKILSFRELGALPLELVLNGLVVGASLMIGTALSRPLLNRLGDRHFRWMMDAITLLAGAWLLVFGLMR